MIHELSFGHSQTYNIEVSNLIRGEYDTGLGLHTFNVHRLPKMRGVMVKDEPVYVDGEYEGLLENVEDLPELTVFTIRTGDDSE